MGDLARADADTLDAVLGDWGTGLARLARGEDLSEVEPYREPVSYSEENTFGSDVSDPETLRATILTHAEAVARRLRNDGVRARTVVLKLTLGRRRAPGPRGYPQLTRQTTLAEASDDGVTFARAGYRLLAREALAEPVRLLGVGVTNIVPQADEQLGLFGPSAEVERRRRLNRALDELSRRFGSDAVARGLAHSPDRAALSHQIKRGEEPG